MAETGTRLGARAAYERLSSGSRALWERALESLPGGNTRTTIFHDPYPVYLVHGRGCRVTDVDGVERLDFVSNYTSLILGHCHPRVVEAVQRQAGRLTSAAAPSELEVELAERIRERLPSVELLRFCNSGTEATMLALRAARAFTGRSKVAAFAGGYHGSHDLAASIPAEAGSPPGAPGVPAALAETLVVAPFDDVEGTRAALEPHLGELAAVIVEPVLGSGGVLPASREFLAFLRELTREAGALLVFDEVISFRVGYHGAQGRLGVTPDLTTLGKIIGGGLPLAAYGGRKDVMSMIAPEGPAYQAGTLSGNPAAVAAGTAMLDLLRTVSPYKRMEQLKEYFCEGLRLAAVRAGVPLRIQSTASMFTPFFLDGEATDYATAIKADKAAYGRFFHEMLKRGVYLPPAQWEAGFVSYAHTDKELDHAIGAAVQAFAVI